MPSARSRAASECGDSRMRFGEEWREMRKCACGCGEFPANRPWQRFKSPRCRLRAWRKRKEAEREVGS